MRLYLKPDDPSHTELTAPSGRTYYKVVSDSSLHRSSVSRPHIHGNKSPNTRRDSIYADSQRGTVKVGEEEKHIAFVTWQCLGGGRVRTAAFEKDGVERNVGFKDLLWKKVMFSSTRYFSDKNNEIYKWKYVRDGDLELTHARTGIVQATYNPEPTFTVRCSHVAQADTFLEIKPEASLDLDSIVLTFLIMEKKRREKKDAAYGIQGDGEPAGDGAMEGG